VTPLGIEPATFRFVVYCLKHRHRAPQGTVYGAEYLLQCVGNNYGNVGISLATR
jgi:hypothetical protein